MSQEGEADTLGSRLRKARLEKKLTQADLAARSGIRIGTLSNLESDKTTNPHQSTVESLARELRIDSGYLIKGSYQAATVIDGVSPLIKAALEELRDEAFLLEAIRKIIREELQPVFAAIDAAALIASDRNERNRKVHARDLVQKK